MGATFSRIKNWGLEIVLNTDLNAEFDNILNNLGPAGVDDYSTNTAQMRLQTSPGASGSESLATSLAGELERLRYVIQRMIGSTSTYWYDAPPSTLSDLVAALGTGLPPNRIVSGRTTGNSSQLCALIPNGTSASVTLTASVTPFVYYIGGVQYSITANQTLTGLSLAPTTNNTCSFNNTAASGQQWTKFQGMYGTTLNVSAMGTNILSLIGQVAGLQAGAEQFIAYVNTSLSLTGAWRGALFNSSGTNVTAVGLTHAAEIKLMKLSWIFANTNSSLAVTYSNPVISATQPTSPSTGDYWFDLTSTAWKTFNSTTWVIANATLIGMTMQNTAACVAARTFDSYKAANALNTLSLDRASTAALVARDMGAEVSIFGSTNRFGPSRPSWDISTGLEAGITETLSVTYYAYMKENGSTVMSDKAPLYRRDLYGLYHPNETWRCLGNIYNDSSTNFATYANTFRDVPSANGVFGDITAYFDYSSTKTVSQGHIASLAFPSRFANMIGDVTNYTAASLTYQPFATLSLTAGFWKIIGYASLGWVGTASAAAFSQLLINTAAGTVATGTTFLHNVVTFGSFGTNSNNNLIMQMPDYYVQVTDATNFIFKGNVANTAAATWNFTGRMIAERLDVEPSVPA